MKTGNSERVTVSRPAPGEWFVCVYAWELTEDLTLVVTAEPDPLVAIVPATLADLSLDGPAPVATVLYPDLVPPPATLPVYVATNLVDSVWTFKTNAPLSQGVLALPLPPPPPNTTPSATRQSPNPPPDSPPAPSLSFGGRLPAAPGRNDFRNRPKGAEECSRGWSEAEPPEGSD